MSDQIDSTVFFTLYESAFDNRILEFNRLHDVQWSDFAELILTERQLVPRKEDVKLIAPVRFLDRGHPACEHAPVTKREAETLHLGAEGDTKFDEDGNPYTWRGAINVEAWSMLPVDIDGEQTIEQAKEFFKEYTYVAYTSFNHLKDGSTEKFRLLLLLSEPVSHKDFTDRIPALKEWLGDVDLSTLAGARGFYLPSCPPDREAIAERWYNAGEKQLDLLSFEVQQPPLRSRATVASITAQFASGDDKQVLLDKLKRTYLGNYEDWWKVSSAMVDGGFCLEDFKYVTIGGMMSQKDSRACEQQWEKAVARQKRGGSVSAGFLYNLVGGGKVLRDAKKERLCKEIEELDMLLGDE